MAAAAKAPGYVVATTSFAGTGDYIVREGDVFAASDPIVKGREVYFAPLIPRDSTRPAEG